MTHGLLMFSSVEWLNLHISEKLRTPHGPNCQRDLCILHFFYVLHHFLREEMQYRPLFSEFLCDLQRKKAYMISL